MKLDDFEFRDALLAANSTEGIDDTERRLRLLAAAEFAASSLTSSGALAPVAVTEVHWWWACRYTMCALGERPSCLKLDPQEKEIPLWLVTVYPGYMQKLDALGYKNANDLGENFVEASTQLKGYLEKYAVGEQIVASGALRLQSSTWKERLPLLGIQVVEHGMIDLPPPPRLEGLASEHAG